MKLSLLLLSVILFGSSAWAQPGDDGGWIKIRSMSFNNSEDVYVRKGSAAAKDYPYIHDTIYVDSFRNRLFALISSTYAMKHKSTSQKLTSDSAICSLTFPVPMAFSSSLIISGEGSTTMTWSGDTLSAYFSSHKARKRKKRKPQYHIGEVRYAEGGCPLDTLVGILDYNNKLPNADLGDAVDSGYWVGCIPNKHIYDGVTLILPFMFQEIEFLDGHREFHAVKNGTFYDSDWNHIGNYRVYGLKL